MARTLNRPVLLGLAVAMVSNPIVVPAGPIDDAAASRIAALSLARASAGYPDLDSSRMPPPVMSMERGKRIFDVRDVAQNVWFVVIVDAAGGAEVSAMQLGVPR